MEGDGDAFGLIVFACFCYVLLLEWSVFYVSEIIVLNHFESSFEACVVIQGGRNCSIPWCKISKILTISTSMPSYARLLILLCQILPHSCDQRHQSRHKI